jgi:hypothetical protein
MSWQPLIEEWKVPLDRWVFTPVINSARFFKLSHNLLGINNQIIGQVAQTEINESKLILFEQKRFTFVESEQIFQFNKPEFFRERVLGFCLTDLRSDPVDIEVKLRIEFFPYIDSLDDALQLNRIENKLDFLLSGYSGEITTYKLILEEAKEEVYKLTIN